MLVAGPFRPDDRASAVCGGQHTACCQAHRPAGRLRGMVSHERHLGEKETRDKYTVRFLFAPDCASLSNCAFGFS